MRFNKLSPREIGMFVLLVVILIGVFYYLFFYKPLQEDMLQISNQTIAADDQINTAMAKATKMQQMQEEVNEILSRPKFEITEIAPYDNKNVVLNTLNGILGASENYSLAFTDPDIEENGTVRRDVSMSFSCEDYNSAKVILRDLSKNTWRCLVKNVSITADSEKAVTDEEEDKADKESDKESDEKEYDPEDLMMNPVKVTATITFFESTQLSK